MQLITVAVAALLAAVPSAQAAKAYVYNNCSFDVYAWSVSADARAPEMITLAAHNGSYNETYQTPSVGGVSLKLSLNQTNANPTPVTQFEYTNIGGKIWYDISNVNCFEAQCPFQPYGMYMDSGDGCPTRSCKGGALTCKGAYTAWNDDVNSLACDNTADIKLYLCTETGPGGKVSSEKREASKHRHGHPHWRS